MPRKNQGTLSRTNQIIFGDSDNSGTHPVFTLHYWKANHQRSLSRNGNKFHPSGNRRAKLLLIKAQESTFNFLFRWLALEESERQERGLDKNRRCSRAIHSIERGPFTKGEGASKQERRRDSLLQNVSNLPDKSWSNIIKFIFWRWLTWANVCELLLLIVLILCCILQCYELLDDYYTYPTHVTITKILNDNFKEDLPAITICNNNRMSKEALRINFPEYNLTHFIAMTFGTFYSLDNYTLPDKAHRYYSIDDQVDDKNVKASELNESDVDWLLVGTFLSKRGVSASSKFKPPYDLVDTVTCANIWGDQMPCEKFKRVTSLQQHAVCVTLFHDSTFWDKSELAVQELDDALKNTPSSTATSGVVGERNSDEDLSSQIIDLTDEDLNAGSDKSDDDPFKLKLEMSNMEVLRLRINFQVEDYANKRAIIGGTLAVHTKSEIASMNHIIYHIEPGLWYSYYLERFDYRRLPAPYETNCYNYEENRADWSARQTLDQSNKWQIHNLIKRQANSPHELIPEYVKSLRRRSLGSRECKYVCGAELPATKCGCWNKDIPYLRDNHVDVNETFAWCNTDILKKVSNGSQIAGDDFFFQLCVKEFFLKCMEACPDECKALTKQALNDEASLVLTSLSNQDRGHHMSRGYITDQRLLKRLKVEGDCCATISVLYAAPSSSLHVTEPKYSRQDMVTIISGNIEAWIGISAAHAYLFLEKLYDSLLEAGLISSSSNRTPRGDSNSDNTNGGSRQSSGAHRRGRFISNRNDGWFSFLISIFTTLKVKVSQLFTYLFHRLFRRLFWSKTNKRVIGQSRVAKSARAPRAAPPIGAGAGAGK